MPNPEITENIRALTQMQMTLHECRLAHLRERARLLHEEFAKKEWYLLEEAFRERYAQESQLPPPPTDEVPREHLSDLARLNEDLHREDAVYFCRVLLTYYRKQFPHALTPMAFCTSREPEQFPIQTNRIAYLKNVFADDAYNKFSRILPGAVVSYCDDFPGVCEEVTSGRARYGILPLENSTDGRLKSFHQLMQKNDLKIILMCDVPMGESMTQFALLGRRVAELDCGRHRASSYFEFRITLSHTRTLSQILWASAYYGLRLLRSSCVEAAQGVEFDLIFSQETADVSAFLCYLSLEHPGFNPVGLYTMLKN